MSLEFRPTGRFHILLGERERLSTREEAIRNVKALALRIIMDQLENAGAALLSPKATDIKA